MAKQRSEVSRVVDEEHFPDREEREPVGQRSQHDVLGKPKEQTDSQIEADLLGAPEFMAGNAMPEQLTVVWPEEYYQPISFHGFRIGPLSLTVGIAPGTCIEAVYRQAWRQLDALARVQFAEKTAAYLDRVKELALEVERRKSR